jgi:endonuclease/exonuclease/phosphatase family metal-dependent hydrolase
VVAFPKPPPPDYDYDVDHEIAALRSYHEQEGKADRAIPAKGKDRLLLATWNIANLGVQKRRPQDYRLIAEIISWFDLIAIQETNGNLAGLQGIRDELAGDHKVIFSDAGGNSERFAFIYDPAKIAVLEEVGHVTIPPSDFPDINLPGVTQGFSGFDRNPYLVTFQAAAKRFVLANVHLFFGDDEDQASIDRRCLEAYAIARWADLRRKDNEAYASDVLALGDFNLPASEEGDPIYQALTRRGLTLPPHRTKVGGTNVQDDQQYDQMAVFPGMEAAIEGMGVFDFDGALFRDLWGSTEDEQKLFIKYVKYYLSDHRPLWAAMRLDA